MAPDQLTIRQAGEHDLIGLLSVKPDARLHWERLACQARGEAAYLVAGNALHPILGYVLLKWCDDHHRAPSPILQDLLVRPDFRSLGVGTGLLRHAETLCCARGLTQIDLRVHPTNNPRAKMLYERLGYRETSDPPQYEIYSFTDETGQRRFYEDCSIQMVKSLCFEPS
jgi:ribosomal protein S18 acetylase RimI-like enzyme